MHKSLSGTVCAQIMLTGGWLCLSLTQENYLNHRPLIATSDATRMRVRRSLLLQHSELEPLHAPQLHGMRVGCRSYKAARSSREEAVLLALQIAAKAADAISAGDVVNRKVPCCALRPLPGSELCISAECNDRATPSTVACMRACNHLFCPPSLTQRGWLCLRCAGAAVPELGPHALRGRDWHGVPCRLHARRPRVLQLLRDELCAVRLQHPAFAACFWSNWFHDHMCCFCSHRSPPVSKPCLIRCWLLPPALTLAKLCWTHNQPAEGKSQHFVALACMLSSSAQPGVHSRPGALRSDSPCGSATIASSVA
jgi:hypothetical protein